jgi:hypothetical protein
MCFGFHWYRQGKRGKVPEFFSGWGGRDRCANRIVPITYMTMRKKIKDAQEDETDGLEGSGIVQANQ